MTQELVQARGRMAVNQRAASVNLTRYADAISLSQNRNDWVRPR